MTILPPVYVKQSLTPGLYQGVMLDVRAADWWITKAACHLLNKTIGMSPGRGDATLDSRIPGDNWEWFYRGKKGEAAYAIHHRLPIETILHDEAGSADFTQGSISIDVKTAETGRAAWITVGANILGKDLARWRIVGAKCSTGGHDVTLLGSIPGPRLTDYPLRAAADGHAKAYLRIPFDDLTPLP